MKKYFCFYCQKEQRPYNFLHWRFCPQCYHRMIDDGEGFYRVCDQCGANMPPITDYCLKCGYAFDKNAIAHQSIKNFLRKKNFYDILLNIAFICISILVLIGVFYLSIYVLFATIIIGGLAWLFNITRRY